MINRRQDLEYKAVRVKVESVDLEKNEFLAYFSVFDNEDLGGDIIKSGAFKKTVKERGGKVHVLYNHDYHIRMPLGKTSVLKEDELGLLTRGKISETTDGKDMLVLLQDGVIEEGSIGYKVIQEEINKENNTRILKEIKLYEVSFVPFAMNPEARLVAVKSAENKQLMDKFDSLMEKMNQMIDKIGETKSLQEEEPEKSTPPIETADAETLTDEEKTSLYLAKERLKREIKRQLRSE